MQWSSSNMESPLDSKIKPVKPKGNQTWIFIGRTDADAQAPILWPPEKSWLIGKDSDAGRDWGQEEKGTTEDEMAGWHNWLDGRWVWVNSGRWWWTGRPGVLRFMGSQRVGHDWATELNWSELCVKVKQARWQNTALMYSFPNLEPVHCSMSGSNCCFLTCIQVSQEAVRWSGVPISWRIFHSLLWSTQSKALA